MSTRCVSNFLLCLSLFHACNARQFGNCYRVEIPLWRTVNLTEVIPTLEVDQIPSFFNKTTEIWECDWVAYGWSIALFAIPGFVMFLIFVIAMVAFCVWHKCCCCPRRKRFFEGLQHKSTQRVQAQFSHHRPSSQCALGAFFAVLSVVVVAGIFCTWIGHFHAADDIIYGLDSYDTTLDRIAGITGITANASTVLEAAIAFVNSTAGLDLPDLGIADYLRYVDSQADHALSSYRRARDLAETLFWVLFGIMLAVTLIIGVMVVLWWVHSIYVNWSRKVYHWVAFTFLFLSALLSVYVAINPVLIVFFSDGCDFLDYIIYGVGDGTGLRALLGCVPPYQDSENVLWDQFKHVFGSEEPIREAVCNATTGCASQPFPDYCSGIAVTDTCEWWATDAIITDTLRTVFTTLQSLISYGLSLLSCTALYNLFVEPTHRMCQAVQGLSLSLAGIVVVLSVASLASAAACLLSYEVLGHLLGRPVEPKPAKKPSRFWFVREAKLYLTPTEAPTPVNDPRELSLPSESESSVRSFPSTTTTDHFQEQFWIGATPNPTPTYVGYGFDGHSNSGNGVGNTGSFAAAKWYLYADPDETFQGPSGAGNEVARGAGDVPEQATFRRPADDTFGQPTPVEW